LAEERVQRRLAAILAADVVGYSRLMESDEAGTLARLQMLRAELLEPKTKEYGGRIVKTMGDGVLIEFPSAVAAVEHALSVQQGMAEREADQPEVKRICLRLGINLGDVIIEGDDIHGDGVNVAARLESLCDPVGVYVSGTVYDHVEGKIAAQFEDLGEKTVKNLAKPVRVYAVRPQSGVSEKMADATEPLPLPDKPSIAVLPFENMSGDPEQEYFADGIAEDIITALSRFSWFFVIARNSSFSYKGTSPDIRKVAQELGVQYVLEGSVRKAANRVRITAQLIDAITGRHIWADRYDRELDDIFAVQDEITEAITGEVAPAFVSAEMRRIERKTPENLDAWDYAMRGNWHLWRLGMDNVAEARQLFETAIGLDSKNSMGLSGLAMACLLQNFYGWTDDPEETRRRANEAAQQAIEADENDAWAQTINCFISSHSLFNYEAALRAGHRALELNPNLAFAEGMLALVYSHLAEYDNVMLHAANAERLSPRDPMCVWWNLARSWAEIVAGRYEEALLWAKKITESNPEFPTGWRHLTAVYAQLGRLDEARAMLAQFQRLAPGVSIALTRERMPAVPQSQDGLERFIDGLRKAGLPE
jgi:TolB-like protein